MQENNRAFLPLCAVYVPATEQVHGLHGCAALVSKDFRYPIHRWDICSSFKLWQNSNIPCRKLSQLRKMELERKHNPMHVRVCADIARLFLQCIQLVSLFLFYSLKKKKMTVVGFCPFAFTYDGICLKRGIIAKTDKMTIPPVALWEENMMLATEQ